MMAQITLRDYVQETEDAISAGQIDKALARCQQLLARFPEFLEAQRLMGEVYLAQGKMEEARHAFDWVLTNDPENALAYCNRALISERVSDFDTALDCYQQAYELSRGNSQIRSEFNKLSTRVGQQGFMFSRAGLARLYMRGDLLAQAMQEWETVLASTPDRLDARLGLLETYWRDGLYDQTEQLARQVLNDVPGCLKARLLLAYIASTRDMEQAVGLLQQARALDPDLLMAQELFTNGTASEQFIQLLKQAPITFEADQSSAYQAALSTPHPPMQSGNASEIPTWSGFEAWGELDAANGISQEQKQDAGLPVSASEAWAELNQISSSSPNNTWGVEAETQQDDSFSAPWMPSSSEDVSTPPAWLNMLTQQERQQMSGTIPSVPSPIESETSSSRKFSQEMAAAQDFAPASTSDNEEGIRFGPEWLKSLGATTYDDQAAQATENVRKEASLEGPPDAREQNVVATLEQLEQNLLSQGFVSHAPHSLSSLSEAIESETSQPSQVIEQPISPYNTNLPSALAEFGNGQTQIEPAASSDETMGMPLQASRSAEEPEWLSPLRAASQASQGVEMPEWTQSPHESAVSERYEELQQPETTQDLADVTMSSPAVTSMFEPMARQTANSNSSMTQATTPARPDPLLEGELETTMRRPAVRLQHLQSQVMAQREAARRGKQTEGASTASAEGGTTSYQDRLLKGYQYQLAGSYEEAMQEYRVIIKGAPELLGEVISNVRALLRLAPKYSAGYRVLGDAYMRQGEYLQAMEAYNKALTMAKKARS